MREKYTFRVFEEHAARFLKPGEGEQNGSLSRKLTLYSDAPRLLDIQEYYNVVKNESSFLFASYDVIRMYDKRELARGEYFQPIPYWVPHGTALYGTPFDTTTTCPLCFSGVEVRAPFLMNISKLPAKKDMFITLDGEVVISERMADLITENAITGCSLEPVFHTTTADDDGQPARLELVPSGQDLQSQAVALGIRVNSSAYTTWLNAPEQRELVNKAHEEYYQKFYRNRPAGKKRFFHLRPDARTLRFAKETVTGTGVFDLDPLNKYRCPKRAESGHAVGFRMLSELFFLRSTHPGTDVAFSADYLGTREGLFWPRSVMVMSRRFYDLCRTWGMKGFGIEIAYAE